jgi:two-component system CitB family sensor kinase
MLALQLAVVAVVVLLSATVFGWLTYQRLGTEAQEQALAVARSVAAAPEVRTQVSQLAEAPPEQLTPLQLAGGSLQQFAEEVRRRTGSLFVVVTDDAGLRLAHPNAQLLGQRVSTDPSGPLAGTEVTSSEQGTLGRSARAKVPVFAPGVATVVGEVSVGYSSAGILDTLGISILPVVLTAAAALGLGAVASVLLGRRLRRLTLGLEPEEIAAQAQDQEAVLRGVDDGVIGVSAEQKITVFNREARRLLDLPAGVDVVGRNLGEAPLPVALAGLLELATPESPAVEQVVGSRVLILTARAVQPKRRLGRKIADEESERRSGPRLGWVVMLRDRTELQSLTRQLDAVGAMSTALRAQRHEFANRLHTVSGLLTMGEYDEARAYVGAVMSTGPLNYPLEQAELLQDPYLQAFIGAKSVEAAERGVTLRLGPETSLRGQVVEPQDVTTVLGNLIDNAVRAAVHGSADERWVEVELLDEPTDGVLHMVVADSGNGLAPADGAAGGRAVGNSAAGGAAGAAAGGTEAADGGGAGLIDGGAAGLAEEIFAEGYSTAAATAATPGTGRSAQPSLVLPDIHGSGFGLPLSRQLARRRGGEVWVADPGRPGGPGAVFCARLPGTMAAREMMEP